MSNDLIATTFAPIAWRPDLPHERPRSADAQVPSDRLRETAATFSRMLVGLTQEPELQEVAIPVLGAIVLECERAIAKRVGIPHPTLPPEPAPELDEKGDPLPPTTRQHTPAERLGEAILSTLFGSGFVPIDDTAAPEPDATEPESGPVNETGAGEAAAEATNADASDTDEDEGRDTEPDTQADNSPES